MLAQVAARNRETTYPIDLIGRSVTNATFSKAQAREFGAMRLEYHLVQDVEREVASLLRKLTSIWPWSEYDGIQYTMLSL